MARKQRKPGWFDQARKGESAFGANVMDPGSNIESEEKIVKSADGTVTKTTVSNKQNTPAFQGMQTEQTQGGVEKEAQKSYSPEQISAFDQSNMGAGDTDSFGNPINTDFAGNQVPYDMDADIRAAQMNRNAGFDDSWGNIVSENPPEAGPFGTSFSGGATQADYENRSLFERIADNNANQPGDVYTGGMTNQWGEPIVPTSTVGSSHRGGIVTQGEPAATSMNPRATAAKATQVIAAEEKVLEEKKETIEQFVADGILPKSALDQFVEPKTEVKPGGHIGRQADNKAKAVIKEHDDKLDGLDKALTDGILTPEQHAKAEALENEQFNAKQEETGGVVLDEFDKIDAENAANNIYEGDAILEDTAAKHLESIEQNFDPEELGEPGAADDGGDGTLIKHPDDTSNIQKKLEGGDDPKGIMADISKWYGDNPILARALMGAVLSYVKTGNIYSALGAGLEGGVGALDSIAAGKAEAATEVAKNAEWDRRQNANFARDLSKLKITASNKAVLAGIKADKDVKEGWGKFTTATAARLGKHWTPEERRDYGIPDQTNAVQQAAIDFQSNYGLANDWYLDNRASTNFEAGLAEWNEHNRSMVDGGNRSGVVKSPISFIESRWTIDNSNLPSELFLGSKPEDVSNAGYKVMNIAKGKGNTITDKDVWKDMHEQFVEQYVVNGRPTDDIQERAEDAGMTPFMYWLNILA